MKIREIIIIIILFFIDLITKTIIEANLDIYDTIPIINNFFSITYIQNTGAAWSILEGQIMFFYVVSIIGIILMYIFLKTYKENQIIERTAILMMIGGTLGNLFDRLLFHYVRDFIDFNIFGYNFPVFNFADIFLVLGITILIITVFFENYIVGYRSGKNND